MPACRSVTRTSRAQAIENLGLLQGTPRCAVGFCPVHALARNSECVINLPWPEMWTQVEKLAPLTGEDPVPPLKAQQFYL